VTSDVQRVVAAPPGQRPPRPPARSESLKSGASSAVVVAALERRTVVIEQRTARTNGRRILNERPVLTAVAADRNGAATQRGNAVERLFR
jgi:hypothetical protein